MRELDWFDGPEERTDTTHRRRRWFPVAIAVPWLVVVGLLVAPSLGRGTPGQTSSDPPERAQADPTTSAAAHTDPDLAGGTWPRTTDAAPDPPALAGAARGDDRQPSARPETLEVTELRGRWRVAPGSEEAAALGLVVARAWLTGVGPPLAIGGLTADGGAYAEHLVVEATERTSAETEVVTVVAVVLREVEGAEPTVTVERLAVPIHWGEEGPRPGGAPWPLPGPSLDPVSPELAPVEDDGAAWDQATAALARAGLGSHRLAGLQQAPDGPLVATVTQGSSRHDVWLRPHVDGYVVAGSTLDGAAPASAEVEDRP